MEQTISSKLVVLCEFDNPADAHIKKGILESNGVKCIIDNEALSSIYPFIFPVKLLVREVDVELARKLLEE